MEQISRARPVGGRDVAEHLRVLRFKGDHLSPQLIEIASECAEAAKVLLIGVRDHG
jgi:hypothetical protein